MWSNFNVSKLGSRSTGEYIDFFFAYSSIYVSAFENLINFLFIFFFKVENDISEGTWKLVKLFRNG